MELTLFLPGLLLPEPVLPDTVFGLRPPALTWMLGRSKRNELPLDWLERCVGLNAPLPAAVLRKIGAGDTAKGSWLCLDPVHWQVGREGIRLGDPADLKLADDESASLRESIAPLFADWGTLSATSPEAWELELARPLALETCPLPDALDKPINPSLPAGEDGREWRHRLAEAQTVLHAHLVNRSREARGCLRVNSLWPWGAGCLPPKSGCDLSVLWTTDPVLRGLATHAGIPSLATPERFELASGRILAILSILHVPARRHDALGWREAMSHLEQAWIAPAREALRQGMLSRLHLIGSNPDTHAHIRWSLEPGDRWRFWRRDQPLTALR